MKRLLQIATVVLPMLVFGASGYAQLGMFSKEQLIEFTPEWHASFPRTLSMQ